MCSPFCSPFKEAEKAVKAATNALRDYQNSQQVQHLSTAITHYRHAYETSNEKHTRFPDIIINYAALLNKQDRLSGGKSNLKEVIHRLEEARAVMKRTRRSENYGVLLNNLGQAYLDRYRISKTGQDLQSARDTFERARLHNRSSTAYASSLIGSASVIWIACELRPLALTDVGELNAAITLLEIAQEQSDDVEMQAECYRHLASVYDLLYKRTKKPRNLDLSIDYYSQSLYRLRPQSPDRARTLIDLAKQHFERQKLPNAQPDLIAARRYRDEAQTLVEQGLETDKVRKEIDVLMDFYSSASSKGPVNHQRRMWRLTQELQSADWTKPLSASQQAYHKPKTRKTGGKKNVASSTHRSHAEILFRDPRGASTEGLKNLLYLDLSI